MFEKFKYPYPYTIFFLFYCSINFTLFSQTHPVHHAERISSSIKIDGLLDEDDWKNAQALTDFYTYDPKVGEKAYQQTEVRVLYDNHAVYFGARMFDTAPDSILTQLSERDSWGGVNVDYLQIVIDTYNDDLNGFGFIITAAGVQGDMRYSDGNYDDSWDAVWFSKVVIDEIGWTAEIKIPYSAIRFPEKPVQDWGLGFERRIRRIREFSTWQKYDPEQDGYIRQLGTLENLSDIQPPLRLSITPYLAAYLENYRDKNNPEFNSTGTFLKGGADLKYGINESFTLDMTLIPDFGQVQSDDQVLNLSPFEIRFSENRPFFTEGTELFDKAGLVYFRRVGGRPVSMYEVYDDLIDTEEVISNPEEAPMFNASKITGRTPKKLGLGLFNAVTANTYAKINDTLSEQDRKFLTGPLTNYNIIVLDQSLKNTSRIGFINTNVWRAGHYRDANVSAMDFRWADKDQRFALSGLAAVSQLFEKQNNGHQSYPKVGYKYAIEAEKISGNFTMSLNHSIINDTYEQNDFGYLSRNNVINNNINFFYRTFEPQGNLLRYWGGLGAYQSFLYRPTDFQSFGLNTWMGVTLKNYLTINLSFWGNPVKGKNFFEPRRKGWYYRTSENFGSNIWFSSDYRKKLAIDLGFNFNVYPLYKEQSYFLNFSPRIRLSDRLSVFYTFQYNIMPSNIGWVTYEDWEDEIEENDITVFGNRKRKTLTNLVSTQYTFSPTMSLFLRLRHYWSGYAYLSYYELKPDGFLNDMEYQGEHDANFNAFTLNLNFTWQFSPGSELSLVWKDDIYSSDNNMNPDYIDNLKNTFGAPQLNSLSLKILYYLDYQMLQGRKTNLRNK